MVVIVHTNTNISTNNSGTNTSTNVTTINTATLNNVGQWQLDPTITFTNTSDPLLDRLVRIEQILGIAARDRLLEKEFSSLRKLGDESDRAISEIHGFLNDTIQELNKKYANLQKECTIMHKLNQNNT